MQLDQMIAGATLRVRNLERALHEDSGWSMKVGDHGYAALRKIFDDGVVFTTKAYVEPHQIVDLYCGDVLVSSRDFKIKRAGNYSLEWAFSLGSALV